MKLKLLTVAALSCIASVLAVAAPAKPNVLFILVDDMGAMDYAAAGSTFYETPNIDALAKDGVTFSNAYSSHPRCLPSRYSIFSGRLPGHDGVPGFQDRKASKHALPLDRVTWGEVLKDNGYSTGYIGKWHLGKDGGEPDKQGFTDSRIANAAGAPPSYFYPYHVARQPGSKESFMKIEGEKGEYLTDRLNDEAIDFIEKNQSKPFALVLAHYAVHTPIEAPEGEVKVYKNKLKKQGLVVGNGRDDADIVTQGNGSSKTLQNHPTYGAMVTSVDRGLGKIRAKLKQLNLDKNTIIILTSDHGGLSTRSKDNNRELATSNLPYRCGKGWLYEGGIRVPHIVSWPDKLTSSSSSSTQTLGADHYPTILELTGCKLPGDVDIDGVSYAPALTGKQSVRPFLFFHSPLGRPTQTGDHPASSLIDGQWKIVELHVSNDLELYNLTTDPGELNNLASKEPEKLQQMHKLLLETKQKLGTKQRTAASKK